MAEARSERIGGWFFISSMVFLLGSTIAAPSGAYQGSISERLAIIEANPGRWILANVLAAFALGAVAAGGLTVIANRSSRSQLRTIGGVFLGIAGVAGVVWLLLLAVIPRQLYERELPAVDILILLTGAGLLALSVEFLCRGYPRWAG